MAPGVEAYRNPATVFGSDEWAEANLRWTRNTLRSAEADCEPLAVNMPHYRAWCERHGRSWEEFCSSELAADPMWIEKIEEGVAILKGRGHRGPVTRRQAVEASQALAADPSVPPLGPPVPAKGGPSPNPGGKTKVDEVNLGLETKVFEGKPKGGNRAEYLVRRLKRDAPEVASELARGELPSARAAAIKAGIVKVPTIVERAFRLVERMTPAERRDFDRQIRPLMETA